MWSWEHCTSIRLTTEGYLGREQNWLPCDAYEGHAEEAKRPISQPVVPKVQYEMLIAR
jgi:hypothetical protein